MSDVLGSDATEALEGLVDSFGLSHVLEALTEICQDKAQHIGTEWQSRPEANIWASSGLAIERVQFTVALKRHREHYGEKL